MNHGARLVVLALCGLSTATLVAGQRLESRDSIGSVRYRTFSLEEGTPARRETARERLATAIERGFTAKGLRRVFGTAEIAVVTHVLVDRHTLADLDRPDYFEYWSGVSAVDAFDVRAGTLVIDVVDVAQKRTVWRGVVSADVKDSAEKNLKLVEKIVGQLIERFPHQ